MHAETAAVICMYGWMEYLNLMAEIGKGKENKNLAIITVSEEEKKK